MLKQNVEDGFSYSIYFDEINIVTFFWVCNEGKTDSKRNETIDFAQKTMKKVENLLKILQNCDVFSNLKYDFILIIIFLIHHNSLRVDQQKSKLSV